MTDLDRDKLKDLVLTEFLHAAFLSDPARLQGWEEQGLTVLQLRVLYRLNADPGMADHVFDGRHREPSYRSIRAGGGSGNGAR